MDWQPIETAPKDGSMVLVWAPDLHGRYRACFDCFSADPDDWIELDITGGMPEGGGWLWSYLDGGPTLWFPLPEPPKDGE